jgi:hypothetical protein
MANVNYANSTNNATIYTLWIAINGVKITEVAEPILNSGAMNISTMRQLSQGDSVDVRFFYNNVGTVSIAAGSPSRFVLAHMF